MEKICIEDGLTLRFPGRDASFREGVEIGMLATLMATGALEITRTIGADTLEQARILAEKLGYRVAETETSAPGSLRITLAHRRQPPRLRLVAASD